MSPAALANNSRADTKASIRFQHIPSGLDEGIRIGFSTASLGRKATASMNETPHKTGICLRDKNSGETVEHIAEFTDDEWRQLHDFLSHVADLQSTQFVAKGSGVQLDFNWSEETGLSCSVKTPPKDEVLAFIHRLRPLILQKEAACFPRVRALLNRKLKDAPIEPFMRWLLDLYEGKEFQKLIVMQSNDRIMNSEEMLVIWLNAYEYHRDRKKQELLESHNKILPLEWSRGVFLNLLVEKTKAISHLGVLVELVLGKRDAISVSYECPCFAAQLQVERTGRKRSVEFSFRGRPPLTKTLAAIGHGVA